MWIIDLLIDCCVNLCVSLSLLKEKFKRTFIYLSYLNSEHGLNVSRPPDEADSDVTDGIYLGNSQLLTVLSHCSWLP